MANFHSKDNYFQILGLPNQAPPKAVTCAYKRLVLQCHLDKNLNIPPGHENTIKFNKITHAYKYLIEYRDYIDYYGSTHESVYPYIQWQQVWMSKLERTETLRRDRQNHDYENLQRCQQQEQQWHYEQQARFEEEQCMQGLQLIVWTPLQQKDDIQADTASDSELGAQQQNPTIMINTIQKLDPNINQRLGRKARMSQTIRKSQ